MANELKITDVVDESVFNQLENLKTEFNENYAAYKKFIGLLANGMKISPKNYQELSDKSNAYNNALNNLITTQNKLASIQERQNKLLGDYGNKITKLLTLNTEPEKVYKIITGFCQILLIPPQSPHHGRGLRIFVNFKVPPVHKIQPHKLINLMRNRQIN